MLTYLNQNRFRSNVKENYYNYLKSKTMEF